MSDTTEEAPAITPDTPTPADTQAEVDYRKRYEDLQPEYTRATQDLASERSIWEDEQAALARFQEKFPHLIVDDADDDDEDDEEPNDEPPAVTDPRVDDLAEWKQSVEADRARDRYDQDFKAEVGEREVPEIGRDWIEDQTLKNGATPEALKAAVVKWFEYEDSRQPTPKKRAAHVPTGGNPSEPETPKTHEARVQRAMDRINAEQA